MLMDISHQQNSQLRKAFGNPAPNPHGQRGQKWLGDAKPRHRATPDPPAGGAETPAAFHTDFGESLRQFCARRSPRAIVLEVGFLQLVHYLTNNCTLFS